MRKITSIYIFMLLAPLAVLAQTTDKNYVKSISYQIETPDGVVNEDDKVEQVTYFDGLGRALQSIAERAGSGGEDLITPFQFDGFGRQPREYLPYPVLGNNGEFIDNPLTPLFGYYYNEFPEDRHPWDINPYSEKHFEDSALSRVQEIGAPGIDWKINKTSDLDHTIKLEYATNNQDNVYRLSVNFQNGNTADPILNFDGWYPNNSGYISKTITKDENWTPTDINRKTVHEFTNNAGQIVLKRSFNEQASTLQIQSTYYVYDDFGNLTFVLSPEASKQIIENGNLSINYQTILDKLAYQYRYDERNRLIEKKIPGKGWEYVVYNKLNQVVFTQDALLEQQNKWLFTKYDSFGRVILTGIANYTADRQTVQNWVDNAAVLWEERKDPPTSFNNQTFYYTNDALPNGTSYEVHTVNYYDSYIDHTGLTLDANVYGINPTLTNTTGLPTVNRVRILNTDDWIVSLTGYDDKGRAIYSASHNYYLDTHDTGKLQLDFIGKSIETTSTHLKTGNAIITIIDYFTYDPMGRLIHHEQKIDDEPVQLIVENQYDELGQLIQKDVGGETFAEGYTDLNNIDITSNGTISSTSTSWNWNAYAKTKGEIQSDNNGGIQYTVLQNDEHVRVGLVKPNTTFQPNEYFDYGIYTLTENGTSKIHLIVGSTSTYNNGQNYGTYQAGDTFKVQREQDGNVRFYHGTTVLETIVATDEALTGKVVFSGPADTGINNLSLVGPDIDKKLQNVDFKYNIRGWLTDINDVHSSDPKSTDLFNFKINYNHLFGINYGSTVEPLYNGNISETIWKTKNTDETKRGYGYWYDDLNRLRRANNRAGANLENIDVNHTFTLWNVTYDQNGNIQKLRRQGYSTSQLYDDLDYSYSGNQLTEVTELSPCNCNTEGFKDDDDLIPSVLADYEYDVNGNMISDRNKKIDTITYNHLNLPLSVVIAGNQTGENGQIDYVYAANGVKMEKTLTPINGLVQTTQYAGSFIYLQSNFEDTILQFISHREGYAMPTPVIPPTNGGESGSVKGFDTGTGQITYSNYQYVFQYKDHLGNIRLTYADDNLDGAVDTSEIIEESNYYPFGLKQRGYNDVVSPNGNSVAQKFKYNGKEFEEDLALNLYDYHARMYDPAIGRMMQIDPHATRYSTVTPYNYTLNSPLNFTDPDGKDFRLIINTDDDGNISLTVQSTIHTYGDKSSDETAKFIESFYEKLGGERSVGEGVSLNFDISVKHHDKKEDAIDATKATAGDNLFEINSEISRKNFNLYPPQEDPKFEGGVQNPGFAVVGGREGKAINAISATHEIGHFFGLGDRYSTVGGKFPITNGGFGGDIMSNHYPTNFNSVHYKNLYHFVIGDIDDSAQRGDTRTIPYTDIGRVPEPDKKPVSTIQPNGPIFNNN